MKYCKRLGAASAVCCCLFSVPAMADSHGASIAPSQTFQMRRLLQPTALERAAEEKGRIYIYDSMEFGDVDRAIDENFDRMQNMMFIRIRHLPPTGSGPVMVEDDDCD